jgi:two-component system, chemotaxis family, chemotaxis protein CheY
MLHERFPEMKKVLIVDDSEMIRQQVAGTLEGAGFIVLTAVDGMAGLECIEQHSDLAMAILDVNMPRLDGLEMLERLGTNPRHAGVPVLILTTEIQPSLIDRAKRAGAKAWMVKPVKPEHLVSTVQRLSR